MATPVAAGTAALMRHFFRAGFYPAGTNASAVAAPFSASGMLIKAAMIGGAVDLAGGIQASQSATIGKAPDRYQGWGRLSLPRSVPLPGAAANVNVAPAGWRLQLVDMVTIADGERHALGGLVGAGGPVTVTLTWYDYPASPGVSVRHSWLCVCGLLTVLRVIRSLQRPNFVVLDGRGRAALLDWFRQRYVKANNMTSEARSCGYEGQPRPRNWHRA